MLEDKAILMNKLSDSHFTVVGAGNIGGILLQRLAAAGVAADHLAVCDADPGRGQAAAQRFGVRSLSLGDADACTADAILLASPPATVLDVLKKIARERLLIFTNTPSGRC